MFNMNSISFSEYKNNENDSQFISEKPLSSSFTVESEEDEDPFEKEFLNSLLDNEEGILEENKDEIKNIYKEDQHDLNKMGKISYSKH